jgi:hypothetical protein
MLLSDNLKRMIEMNTKRPNHHLYRKSLKEDDGPNEAAHEKTHKDTDNPLSLSR